MSNIGVKRIKKQMKEEWVNPSPENPRFSRYLTVDTAITRLANTHPISISEKAVTQHEEEVESITNQIFELQKKLDERYEKTYKKILDEL
jgi:predicted HTH transcriptional regulator